MTAQQILLAEDEAILRAIAAEVLASAGFAVIEAADGEEALALLKQHPDVALLISDIKMPRMDGYALVEASVQLRPDLKVVMMTGYAQGEPPASLCRLQIKTLRKPFNLDELCELAAKLLEKS